MNYFFSIFTRLGTSWLQHSQSFFTLYLPHHPHLSRSKNKELNWREWGENSKRCFHRMSFTVIRTRHERTKKRNKKKETVKKRKSKEMKISFLSFCYCCCCCLFKNLPKVKFFLARFQCLFIFIWRFIQWDMREWKRNIAERGKSTQKNVVMRI